MTNKHVIISYFHSSMGKPIAQDILSRGREFEPHPAQNSNRLNPWQRDYQRLKDEDNAHMERIHQVAEDSTVIEVETNYEVQDSEGNNRIVQVYTSYTINE